jgi:hypothetical protein
MYEGNGLLQVETCIDVQIFSRQSGRWWPTHTIYSFVSSSANLYAGPSRYFYSFVLFSILAPFFKVISTFHNDL